MLTKERWVAALRSGKYEQGSGKLRTGDRFCCLGVACDLYDPEGWENQHDRYEYHVGGFTSIVAFPRELSKMLNLNQDLERVLTGMNDQGWSFEAIADYIETHL